MAGQNVNMVSGTDWTNGDPFLQRQNEPSIAVSSRNSSHLLAGANDYRTVDLPGVLGIDERGDAWLGLFKSFDAGRTWQSTLVPGFPLDGSPQGLASPIHGFQAASDPTVRAGANGIFYYTGLAFNRGNNPLSAVFISRFVDLNNKENGDAGFEGGSMTNLQPRDTIRYVDTTVLARGTAPVGNVPGTFVDKPWVATDIPRGGGTCTISVQEDGKTVMQTIPAAPVYMTYTSFIGNGASQVSTINFRRSLDCGATWSSPAVLSQNNEASGVADAEHQGTVIAIDPSVPPSEPATVYVAWRRFANPSDPDDPPAIFLAKSADGGAHWGTAFAAVVFPNSCIKFPAGIGCPFDQVFTNASFRSNGYPALTVDSLGRVYVAWSQRDANGDGKIMMGIAPGGRSIQSASIAPVDIGPVVDDNGNAFSNLSGRGNQLMPSLSFESGKLILAYYDLRQDHTTGNFAEAPDPNCNPLITLPCALGGQYNESRTLEAELDPFSASYNPAAVFSLPPVTMGQNVQTPYVADSSPLTVRRHTIDVMGAEAVPPPASSLQPPAFKSFRITNYLFGSIPQLFGDVEQIQYNAPNLPLFVDGTAPFMGDYIDVSGSPQIVPDGKGGWTFNTDPSSNPVFHAAWTDNRDVVPPADGNWKNYTPPFSASNSGGPSKFDPSQQPLPCVVGQTGMRNQNIYTSEISQGVVLTSPQTSKPVLTPAGQPIQRAFVVELRNASNAARGFQVTIPIQPATATASFSQFSSVTAQTVKVNAFSSQSFPVFVVANSGSTVAFPSVLVTAAENDGSSPPLTGSVLLNPDPTNPALASPDNAAIGANQIAVNEFYNPGVANPGVANSGVPNPGVANPGVANPGVANPGVANPTVVVALNPGVANPGVANPGVANPGVANPGVANESVTDASYSFTNEGNTTAAYTIQFFQSAPFPTDAQFQIILSKLYFTQQAVGCQSQQVGTNVVVANVTNPVFVSNPAQLGTPGVANVGVQTPTINLAPGESGQITIRTNLSVAQVESQVLPNVSPVAVSQAVNTVDVHNGIFTPPLNLLITSTSASVPTGEVNLAYNTTLTFIGGNTGGHNWTIASGSLPPGLQLNAASGAITGTPTLAGSFPFTAEVMDTGTPQHTAMRALAITIVAPVAITTPSPTLAEGVSGSAYAQTFSASAGVPPYRWSTAGPLPTGLALGSSGLLSGTPSAGGAFNFTVKATDAIGAVASAPYTILVTNPVPAGTQVQFVTQPANSIGGQAISPAVGVRVVDATGAVLPNVLVAMSFGTQACPAAALSGTLITPTGNTGIATFPDLVINRGQTGYTLSATAGNVSSVSNPFTVNGFCAAKGQISVPRELHSAVTLLDGTVLVAGGGTRLPRVSSPGLPVASAELYNPSTGTFSATGSMNVPRWGQTTTLLRDGRVLIAGGVNSSSTAAGSVTNTAEIYDPASHTFTLTNGPMNSARFLHTATLLADGRVLLAGGGTTVPPDCIICFGVTTTNTAEIFDPATGLFTPTSTPLVVQRQVSTATLMPNGQVLLAGGLTDGPTFTSSSSAEIFDPVSNGFRATSSMAAPRVLHSAALLPSGKVLVAGGTFDTTATAELYDPGTGTFAATGNLVGPSGLPAIVLTDGTALLSSQNAQVYNGSTGVFTATGPLVVSQNIFYGVSLLQDGTILTTGGETLFNTVPDLGTITDAEVYYSTAPLAPMQITTTVLAAAATGKPFTQMLLEQGGVGNLTWTEAGTLPTGMSLSPQGVLSGTPTVTGSFPLTVTVTDSSTPPKTISSGFTLTVVNSFLMFTPPFTMPTALVGKPYTQPLPVTGGTQPYNSTLSGGTLPPGLNLAGSLLVGTPTATGTFAFTVTVTDSSTPTPQTATQTLTIAVNTLAITTTALPSGIVGVSYNAAISTTGGTLPLSFSASAGLPPGLSIQPPSGSTSALAGTPTAAGNFFFTVTVVDSSTPPQTAVQNYEVTIAPVGTPVPASITFVSQPQNSVGGQTLSPGPIVVRVADASNNPVPGTTVAMTFNGLFGGSLPCSVATLSGTLAAVTDATGQATFSDLSIDRGGYNYTLLASTGSVSLPSASFSVQGFCASGNLSTQREGHTQDLVQNTQSTFKFPLDPAGTYLFTAPQDTSKPPLIIPLASLGIQPGDVISALPVGDMNFCGFVGEFCFAEVFQPFTCAVFSSSNTLNLPSSGLHRVPGAIAPNFTTAFPCSTSPSSIGNFPTDISEDFIAFGEPVTVPPGAAYLFVGIVDIFYADNTDANGDLGVQITVNSPTSVNGEVLIAGGVDNNGFALNTAELYHPLLGFTSPTGNLTDPNGRANHVSVELADGRVLLIGGVSNIQVLATAELYDPTTGTFAATGSMAHPRGLPAAVLLADGRVLVSGGLFTNVASDTAEIYDPATGLWTPTGNMNQGRTRHTMTLLPNGKVLVTGGRDQSINFNALASAEIFDPFANQGVGAFTAIGNMNSPRFKHTATLLSNGKVLLAGGFNGGNESLSVASAEVFDPTTNTFTPTGSMNVPRARQTATLLPDGTVLEAGAINSFNGLVAAAPAELYSPVSGTFALTGQMITGRELPSATLLPPNGNVLVTGGDDGVNVLATTEVYYNPVVKQPIAITTTTIPNAFVGQPYVAMALEQNSAGPVKWSIISGALPPGINGSTIGTYGVASGTPTTAGSFTFTAQVTDGISTATATFTINVSLLPLAFTSSTMPSAGAGRAYSQPLPVAGGTPPYTATVSGGAVPPGLAVSTNGIVSGTPTSAGSFSFTVNVTDSSTPSQSATQTLTMAVDTLSIVTTVLPDGMVGTPYNAVISTVGGTLPLSFSLTNALFPPPPGLTITQPAANSQSGALAGMPTLPGHYTFSETVTDSSSPAQTATQTYVMDIFTAGTTAVPATLTFLSQPQNSIGGQTLAGSPIRVRVFDATNTPIGGASVAMSFNGAPPCSSAVLSGTLTAVTNLNGVAVFPDLSIDRGQLGYTLLANAGSASAVSQPFIVNGFCPTGPMNTARALHSSVALPNGKVLIAGGAPSFSNRAVAFSSAELYDPTTHSFTSVGSMHSGRSAFNMTLLQKGLVLVTGGFNGSMAVSSAELFDPSTNSFNLLPASMVNARIEGAATLLTNGKVLISGGVGNGGVLASAEIFDPATNTFIATSQPMTTARDLHQAVLLPNGKVLITGGYSQTGPSNALASAELYDPVTDTFTLTGSMAAPRYEHPAALLFTGKVLVGGGFSANNFSSPLATAEIYDPSSGTFTSTATAPQVMVGFLGAVPILPDGTVFLAFATTAFIYEPIAGTFGVTGNTTAFQAQPLTSLLADGTVLVTGGVDSTINTAIADAEIYYSTATLGSFTLSGDWSNTTNPNGPWSYKQGSTPLPLVANWTAANSAFVGCNQPAWAPSNSGGNFLPALMNANSCTATALGTDPVNGLPNVLPGDIVTHTVDPFNGNPANGVAHVVFTLPSGDDGQYEIRGSVWDAGLSFGTTRPQDWKLLIKGVQVAAGVLSGSVSRSQAQAFDVFATLAAGDTVDLQLFEDPTSAAGYFVGTNMSITRQ